jgi:hypothetical protein
MRHLLRSGAVALASLVTAAAANPGDTQSWPTLNVDVALSKKIAVGVQGQARLTDTISRFGVTVLRPSISYRLNQHVTIVLGYSHLESGGNGARDIHEDNLFQQVNWMIGKIGTATVRSRTYLEQRWSNGGSEMALRLRQRIRIEFPLGKGPLTAVASTEGFAALNSTDWGIRAGFDQVRNFVGLNAMVAKGVTLEVGYMNRYQRRFGIADRDDHIIPVIVTVRL